MYEEFVVQPAVLALLLRRCNLFAPSLKAFAAIVPRSATSLDLHTISIDASLDSFTIITILDLGERPWIEGIPVGHHMYLASPHVRVVPGGIMWSTPIGH